MIDKDKDDKILILLKKLVATTFDVTASLINLVITLIIIAGAASSMLLLIKLYPDSARTLLVPFYKLFVIMFKLIALFISALLSFAVTYLFIKYLLKPFVISLDEKRKINREKFKQQLADDIYNKIKKRKAA